MKPGDLVQIDCNIMTCPMYPDEGTGEFGWQKTHIGYAKPGTICAFLGSNELKDSSRGLIFHRLIMPEHGIVWVRNAWVKEVS
jgi:hypothetical protein